MTKENNLKAKLLIIKTYHISSDSILYYVVGLFLNLWEYLKIFCTGAGKSKLNYTKTVALVNQYFPPDYAATGQLLDDLTKRIATKNLNFLIFTGQPSYSYDLKYASRREKDGSRLIIRTNTSRLFPRTIKGKTINSFIFSFSFIFLI